MNVEWMNVLNKVKNGLLTVEEGARELEALDGEHTPAAGAERHAQNAEQGEVFEPQEKPEDCQPEIGRWKDAWFIPFWAGTGIFVLSSLWMGWAISTHHSFSTFCAGVPMLFGLLLLFVGWWSRQARWMHVRVQEPGGRRVAISMPLPLGLASWVLRVFSPIIPQMRQQKLDKLPDLLDDLSRVKEPLSVEVDEKDGDRVRVYIL